MLAVTRVRSATTERISPTTTAHRARGGQALQALGDPTRRAIFERLVVRPHSVRELSDRLPVSRPAVSQHLRVLKHSGLVIDHAEGTRRIYRVDPGGIEAMRAYLDQMWDAALAAFAAAVDDQPPVDDQPLVPDQPPKPPKGHPQ